MAKTLAQMNKFRISRRGRKLQVSDDPRTLLALPRDVPERTWAEILQKEENELLCLEIREEILDEALRIGYDNYMDKQNTFFTVHCAAQAWLKLIDWNFYRHDPGEDPSAHPLCYIPKRVESWTPDELPDPSPKDTWSRQELQVVEECPDNVLQTWPSSTSLDYPIVEEIPEECRFPGKVVLGGLPSPIPSPPREERRRTIESEPVRRRTMSDAGAGLVTGSSSSSSRIGTESEVLQKVTDYDNEPAPKARSSKQSTVKRTTPVDGSLQGAGDATPAAVGKLPKRRSRTDKSKSQGWSRVSIAKSRGVLLPPLLADSLSAVTMVSDCRLRNLRLDTTFEVSTEKVDTPLGEPTKRK